MDAIRIDQFESYQKHWKGKVVAVIGDVMLDHFFWGSVSRLSPEAPVPIVDLQEESYHLGGAANVSHNLYCLGIRPITFGIVGDDSWGKIFLELLELEGMETAGIVIDSTRPTTVKTRIIGNNQHIARLDREERSEIRHEIAAQFIGTISAYLSEVDAIIFQDYDKGAITPLVIEEIKKRADAKGIPIFVDPKFRNFFRYTDVTFFKPNRKETQDALARPLQNLEDIFAAGKELLKRLAAHAVLITLGADGMVLFEPQREPFYIRTRARHVADVSGAGDTVIAVFTAAFLGGAPLQEAAALSNIAAGVVCEEPGIVPITLRLLEKAVQQMSHTYDHIS